MQKGYSRRGDDILLLLLHLEFDKLWLKDSGIPHWLWCAVLALWGVRHFSFTRPLILSMSSHCQPVGRAGVQCKKQFRAGERCNFRFLCWCKMMVRFLFKEQIRSICESSSPGIPKFHSIYVSEKPVATRDHCASHVFHLRLWPDSLVSGPARKQDHDSWCLHLLSLHLRRKLLLDKFFRKIRANSRQVGKWDYGIIGGLFFPFMEICRTSRGKITFLT